MPTSLTNPFGLTNALDASTGPGAYSDNMWYKWESLKDPAIQMALQERYKTNSLYRALVATTVVMRNPNGSIPESMTVKGVFDMEPNGVEPIGMRQIWLKSNYTDAFSQSIRFNHFGDKVVAHKYDSAVQAYLYRGTPGLIPMARTMLGQSVTVNLDIQSRNAYLSGPRMHYSDPTNVTSFANISQSAGRGKYNLAENRDIWMDLTYEDVPMASSPLGNSVGTLICVTTPSVIREIIEQVRAIGGDWIDVVKYANPEMALRYEVGSFDNVRFIAARRNVLWNCGTITVQMATAEAYNAADGATAQLVDGVYQVGQPAAAGVRNYIELSALTTGTIADFHVNDMVTIHTRRFATAPTDGKGVLNGVDYREGTAKLRRVVEVDTTNSRIAFDKPLFYEFPAGSFVTKAEHIHPSTYVAGPEGVINAVAEPINFVEPDAIDDLKAIWRFAWDGYYQQQVYRPEVFRTMFSAGRTPRWGVGVAP